MKDKTLRNYLIWAFALAWPLQALASWLALRGHAALFQGLMIVVMFAPLAAALLAKIPLRGMGWGLPMKGRWGWYLAAWLAPVVLGALGAALYFGLFPARFDGSGALLRAQYGEEIMARLEAAHLTPKLLLLISFVQAVTYAPFLNAIPALGEEVGWRGAMYPRLKARFGKTAGRLLGGVIWGAWHWPVMILAGYEYGLHYWGAPVLGMLLFCLMSAAMGTLLDLVYEKTGSIWAPSLGHGAVNAAAGLPLLLLDPAYADRLTVGPLMIGVIGGAPLLLLALFVLLKKDAEPGKLSENTQTLLD